MVFVTCLCGQTPTGDISGVVRDSSGALVRKAIVTIRNRATGLTVSREADNTGQYTAALLPPGNYDVVAKAPGFKTEHENNVTLDVAQERVIDFKLPVGDVSESVTVTAESAATTDAMTSYTGQVITEMEISDLPLNGRNPLDLQELAAGVSTVGDASNTPPHISGSRNGNNEQAIDGISNIVPTNNIGNGIITYQPVVDSVQEFSVVTSVQPAEYGRFSGGETNLVTKSGTNTLHGTAFLFAHNNVFDALNYFHAQGAAVPSAHRYQYGGVIGGPVVMPHFYNGHNRTFFFLAYERSRINTATTEIDTVPLPAWRTGDFSSLAAPIYDPASAVTTSSAGTIRTQAFTNNQIPADRQNAVALAAIGYYPAPNYGSAGAQVNNYNASGSNGERYDHGDARLDQQFGSKNHAFARFSEYNDQTAPFNDFGNAAARTGTGPQQTTETSVSLDDVQSFTPTLIGEIRYGLSRYTVVRTAFGQGFNLTSLGLPSSYQSVSALRAAVFPSFDMAQGYTGLGMNGGYVPYSSFNTSHDASASLIKSIGRHTIKVGGEFRELFVNYYQYAYPSGEFSFNQTWTQKNPNSADGSGNSFASFLLGLPQTGYMTHDITNLTSSSYVAGFGQDDWRVTDRLTLNLGLRWDGEVPRTDRHNQLVYWDPTLPSPLAGQVVSADCPACSSLMGAMEFAGTSGARYGRRQAPFQAENFAPRVGLSFSPLPKWTLRAGYAVLFAPSALTAAGSTGGIGNDGFASTTQFEFSTDSEATIYTTLGNPALAGFNLPTGSKLGAGTDLGSAINFPYFDSVRNPYTEQANLTVQRELPLHTLAEVGYVYSHGLFLINGDPGKPYDQVNPSYLSLGNQLNANVQNPFYGKITTPGSVLANPTVPLKYLLDPYPQYTTVISERKPNAASIYNSIIVRLDRRFSQGFSLLLSYTGAKLMDNSASAVTFLGPTSGTYANQYAPQKEWGLSAEDLSSNLVIAGTYELPFGRGRRFLSRPNEAMELLAGGWQAATIVTANQGTPVVLSAAINQTGLLTQNQRPDKAPGDPNIPNHSLANWFNTTLFSQPAQFTIGNAPRVLSNVRTSGERNADISLLKNNYLSHDDRMNAQFRLECFNALNHPQFAAPNTNVNSAAFGTINSQANSPRVVQLAAKFIF
jgi:hypothetical protein